MNEQQQQKLDEILKKHEYKSNLVIAIMQDVQKEYHYLPEEALCYIAKELKMSEAKIYGVATFYENFSLEPKGKFVIKICDGTACHVRKSVPILEEFRKTLGVTQEKPTSDDMLFTVETVSCLGACGLAPVCTVNDHVHPSMTPEKARELIKQLKEEARMKIKNREELIAKQEEYRASLNSQRKQILICARNRLRSRRLIRDLRKNERYH